jgi:hypothetical protein
MNNFKFNIGEEIHFDDGDRGFLNLTYKIIGRSEHLNQERRYTCEVNVHGEKMTTNVPEYFLTSIKQRNESQIEFIKIPVTTEYVTIPVQIVNKK